MSLTTKENGHCRVPHKYDANKKLGWWVMNIRAQHNKYVRREPSWLTDDVVIMLEDLGFEWAPVPDQPYRSA